MDAEYDILFKRGHIIDPKNGLDGIADIAVRGNEIAAVGPDLPGRAGTVVDLSGLYVTPGLIDIHVHVYGGFSGWLFPDPHALPEGVTTVVDAGSCGWKDFEDFKRSIVEPSTTRVLAFLNIVGAGMTGPPEQDISEMDPEPCADLVRQHPRSIVGVKSAHFGGPGWESAGGAIEAARRSGTIAMIDFAPKPTRTYEDLLERLAPGDIHTHMYAGHIPLLDESGEVNEYVRAARERGVLFDTGHGSISFCFRNAVPALEQGFPPDTISTDLHRASRLRTNAVMTAVISKFLALGMPLGEAVYRSTQRPAEVIGRPELGHLGVGAEADAAAFALEQGEFGFVDGDLTCMRASRRLECRLTLRAGKIVWDPTGLSRPRWRRASQESL